jgi:hypothetical protein
MNEAREILLANGYWNNGEDIDTALKQLRELVEGKKVKEEPGIFIDLTGFSQEQKEKLLKWTEQSYQRGIVKGNNRAVSDIADMIYKPTKERG